MPLMQAYVMMLWLEDGIERKAKVGHSGRVSTACLSEISLTLVSK